MNSSVSEIGLIGLAVMGQNLALNIADHGFSISVFNRTYSKTLGFLEENEETKNLVGFEKIDEFVNSLERPRKIVIMVQAGKATDSVIETLLPLLDQGDIVIDGGNAKWTDTIDREKRLKDKNLHFVGSGVSGGEGNLKQYLFRPCQRSVLVTMARPDPGRHDQGRRPLAHKHFEEKAQAFLAQGNCQGLPRTSRLGELGLHG